MSINNSTPAQYSIVSYDLVTRLCVIQVDGCNLETEIQIPPSLVQGSAAWNALLQNVTDSVLSNMDPNNPNYDPSLIEGD